jgi:hypothetical protein
MLWRDAYGLMMVRKTERHPFLKLALDRARAHDAVEIALPRDDGLALDVVPKEGPPFRLDLHGLHLETLDAGPAGRAAALDHRLTLACRPSGLPASWSVVAPDLRVVLRSGSLLLDGPELVARPVGSCLVEAVVLDGPESYAYVTRSHLEPWGVSTEEAFATARSNLSGTDASVPWDPTPAAPIWSYETVDGHATSRLLLPGWLQGFADRVQGRPIAAAPHASLLLVTGDAHPAVMARVARAAAREYASSPQPITPVLLRSTEEGLEPARVGPEHPAFDALEDARVRAWAMDVAAQAEAWGEPVEPVGVRQADGRLATGARARSGASRLPEAEVYLQVATAASSLIEGSWPRWRLRD